MEREINKFLCKDNFKNLIQILKNLKILINFNYFLICINRLKMTYI